eukprot:UN06883
MCVLKTGYLFVASEFGNHYLFTFKAIGDNDDAPETSNLTPYSQHVYFTPRKLENLILTDESQSLSPIVDIKVEDLAHDDTPQIYALCGRGSRSSLRVLKHGLTVTEMAVSEITGTPTAVWSIPKDPNSDHHSFIVVSFLNATMVLSIGETVEEVSNSGFNKNTPTVSAGLFGSDMLCQVYKYAVRLISGSDSTRAWEWTPPGKKEIIQCAQNGRQLCLALNGGELVYFELDRYNNLVEVTRKELGVEVTALALEPLPLDRVQSKFLAVGCFDGSVRLMSLGSNDPLEEKTVIMMGEREQVSAILFKRLGVKLYLYVGTQSGNCARLVVDNSDGKLSDKRARFLGTRPVKLFLIQIRGEAAVLALSSRSWVTYSFQGRLVQVPLSYLQLEYGACFKSELCPEGIVAISDNTLRIITLEKLGEMFNQTVYPLRYTPRQMLVNPITQSLIICEADHGAYPLAEKEAIQQHIQDALNDLLNEGDKEEKKPLDEAFIGIPKAQSGKWGSCIRIMEPNSGFTQYEIELDDNEAAFRMCLCQFSKTQELYLIVGTVKDYEMNPKRLTSAFIHTYQFVENYKRLKLFHKTRVHDIPLAMTAFKGRLLVGIGKTLRLYDLGRKKLLKKCENRGFPNCICNIQVALAGTGGADSDRIYVSDMADGINVVTHREREKQMFVFADTITPRYITSTLVLDYDTCAHADKFGNISISRVQMKGYAEMGTEATWNKSQFAASLNGAPLKMQDLVHFHV